MTVAALGVAGHLARISVVPRTFVRRVVATVDRAKEVAVFDDSRIATDQRALGMGCFRGLVQLERRVIEPLDEELVDKKLSSRTDQNGLFRQDNGACPEQPHTDPTEFQ